MLGSSIRLVLVSTLSLSLAVPIMKMHHAPGNVSAELGTSYPEPSTPFPQPSGSVPKPSKPSPVSGSANDSDSDSDSTPLWAASATWPKLNSIANNAGLIQKLLSAPKAVDRIALIPLDSDFVFDFHAPPKGSAASAGHGGHAVAADRVSFPALIGSHAAMTVGFLGPCGFNTPHTHPRSAELNILVAGALRTQFVLENKARAVAATLLPFQMTVFPPGALHTEYNPGCTNATFVAAYADEDPGTRQAAQAFFGLEPEVVRAAVGNGFAWEGEEVARFRDLIPKNVAEGVESCLRMCGVVKG